MGQAKRRIGTLILLRKGDYILLGFNKKRGYWELPGGKMDDDDNSVLDAALRELKEETAREPWGKLTFREYIDTNDEYLILIFTGMIHYQEDIKCEQPNPEAEKYESWRWFNLYKDELPPMTWISAEALRKSLGVYNFENSQKCPYPKLKKTEVAEVVQSTTSA